MKASPHRADGRRQVVEDVRLVAQGERAIAAVLAQDLARDEVSPGGWLVLEVELAPLDVLGDLDLADARVVGAPVLLQELEQTRLGRCPETGGHPRLHPLEAVDELLL